MVELLAQDFVVHVSDVNTLEDNFEMIEHYGKMFSVEEIANEIIQKTSDEKDEFLKYVRDQPVLKVAYFIWRNPWIDRKSTRLNSSHVANSYTVIGLKKKNET